MCAKTPTGIDLSFRPASYFGPVRLEDHLTSRIGGHVRRCLVKRALGRGEVVPAELLESTLDATLLLAFTAAHPALLGGEFLPHQRAGQVEVARISLASTTGDQVVVRVRKTSQRLRYSVDDEYDGEYLEPGYRPRSSVLPLTLGQLIEFIDASYDVLGVIEMNLEGGADRSRLRSFVSVSSEFYPELGRHYDAAVREFLGEDEDEYAGADGGAGDRAVAEEKDDA